jgi:hypothetical protein
MVAAIAGWPSRLGQAACPSEIAVIDPPFNKRAVNTFTFQNLTNDGGGNPTESIVLDEAQNQSFLGSKLGALIHLERMSFFSNCGRDGMD